MIEANRFAKPTLTSGDGRSFFRFAVSPEGTAAELRKMADAVESGSILVQRVQTGHVASVDDFCMQAIMIEFVERENLEKMPEGPERDIVGLYADARGFPVALGARNR